MLSEMLGTSGGFCGRLHRRKGGQSRGRPQGPGDFWCLENIRYYNEEEANDPAFAEKMAEVADVYVNDAFGSAHRAHASTEGVASVVAKRGGKCAAGLLMERELQFLGRRTGKSRPPFCRHPRRRESLRQNQGH